MYLIVGLGNPGAKYAHTRHNVGFLTVDELAERQNAPVQKLKFKALTNLLTIAGEKVLVMKPVTYMNLSGEAVRPAADFYKIPPERILVISDDTALDPGKLRIRTKGSAGGHNGLKNIIQHLGTDQFPRVRVGVGEKPHPDYDMADWVLGKLQGEDKKAVEAAVERHYIPESAAYYVAEKLGVKPTQVYDVISFYSALHDKPRAKFTLEVCSSAPCRVKDSDTLLERLKRLLNLEVGEVTYDGRFSIEKVPCFGACDVSPAVRVNGVVYGHLDSEERILDMLQQLN